MRNYACAIWVTYFIVTGALVIPVWLVAVALAERFWDRVAPHYSRFVRHGGEKYILSVALGAPFGVGLFAVAFGFLGGLLDGAVPRQACEFNAAYGLGGGMLVALVLKWWWLPLVEELRSPKSIWKPDPYEP